MSQRKGNHVNEVEQYILSKNEKKRLVLCGAHGRNALEAVVDAKKKGVITAILIGDEPKILSLLDAMEEDPADYEIIHEPSDHKSAQMAVDFVREGRADIEMKGEMPSSDFLLPIMTPFFGLLDQGRLMSEATAFYYPDQDRMLFVTDCALNISPTLDDKVKLIQNAVELARSFGFEKVKVAVISALEKENPQIPSTTEGVQLAQMEWDTGIEVAGPFALDNALDAVAAQEKGITSPLAGCADVLIMPDLCSGNVFHKCLHYLGHLEGAGVVCGTNKPVVFTSRSDSAESKYNAILSAILQADT